MDLLNIWLQNLAPYRGHLLDARACLLDVFLKLLCPNYICYFHLWGFHYYLWSQHFIFDSLSIVVILKIESDYVKYIFFSLYDSN